MQMVFFSVIEPKAVTEAISHFSKHTHSNDICQVEGQFYACITEMLTAAFNCVLSHIYISEGPHL